MIRKYLKQIILLGLIFVPLFNFTGWVTVHASEKCVDTDRNVIEGITSKEECLAQNPGNHWYVFNTTPIDGIEGGGPVKTNISGDVTNDSGWWLNAVIRPAVGWVVLTGLRIVSLLTGLAGGLLNAVIYYTVLHMSNGYNQLNGPINVTWEVIRDIANMGFIFMLLYASIKTIIGQGGDTKRLIISMVIAALLVNFSLFFTKVAIDASNLISLTLYNAIAPGAAATGDMQSYGLSNSFMNQLHLTSLYASSGDGTGHLGVDSIITTGFLGTIMLLVTVFVFFSISFMFIARYVVLIFVLILSPIAFVASVFPGLTKYRKQWIDALTGQAMFPPVYFLLTWITLTVEGGLMSTDVFGLNGQSTGAALSKVTLEGASVSNGGPFFVVLLNFAIIIAFMIISLVVAKQTAAKTGFGVAGLTSKITGYAGGAIFGRAIGGGLRNTVGRAGSSISENAKLQEAAAAGSTRARLALYASRKARSASFDVRNAAVPTSAIGDLARGTVGRTRVGKALGLDDLRTSSIPVGEMAASATGVGRGTEGGYKEKRKEKGERMRQEARANADELRAAQSRAVIEDGIEANETPAASRTPEQNDAIKEMVIAIKQMSDKEIEAQKASTLAIKEVAEELSAKQLEKIVGSDNYTEKEKGDILSAHFETTANALDAIANGTATNDQENIVRNLSDKEVELLPKAVFDPSNPTGSREKAFISTITKDQLEKLTGSNNNKLTGAEKQNIRNEKNRPLDEALNGNPALHIPANPAEARRIMGQMDPQSLSRLETPYLTNPAILDIYTPQLLAKMAPHISVPKAAAIRTAIAAAAPYTPLTGNLAQADIWLKSPAGNIF